nr:hypothetical protein Iba_chr09bCG10550 [Ipomoea batatas]
MNKIWQFGKVGLRRINRVPRGKRMNPLNKQTPSLRAPMNSRQAAQLCRTTNNVRSLGFLIKARDDNNLRIT